MNGKLKILSAGAGAGKTSRLSQDIVKAIQSGVRADRIMATTFTTKAADELIARIREKLLETGDAESATRILDGYVGTMNSVFGRLLREFAFELGLSPNQTVLEGNHVLTLFNSVTSEIIDNCYRTNRHVFTRMGLETWREIVVNIVNSARQNRLMPEDVRTGGQYSWMTLSKYLPAAFSNAEQLDQDLRSALVVARSYLPGGDSTIGTAKVIEEMDAVMEAWHRQGYITWQQWIKLSNLSPSAPSKEAVAPVIEAASKQDRHPRLHSDIKESMDALFHCAADAMELYAGEKAKRGLIDFTDQEALALRLLTESKWEQAVSERISHVYVDEFQDCSPLQLALIVRLRQLSLSSTWVGDIKQAIFRFRGTDPSLMSAAMSHIDEQDIEILNQSYRSRQSLVDFVNEVFTPPFEHIGIPSDKVRLIPKRKDAPTQTRALETWLFSGSSNVEGDLASLAVGVAEMLEESDDYLITDRETGVLRPILPGDMAILCRSNEECRKTADALAKLGIRATVGRTGLLGTPEAVLASAAFRYLTDPTDTLALAEVLHFTSKQWGDGRWFETWLKSDDLANSFDDDEIIHSLKDARGMATHMSPAEVLDMALSLARVDEQALSWGRGDQGLANLDAIRGLAALYEESCAVDGTAATAGGLTLYMRFIASETDSDLNQIAVEVTKDAVQVMTYHKAKGLEWPVVIMTSLHKSSERKNPPPAFDTVTALSEAALDLHDPLANRRLYYWPWPYGKSSKNVGLDAHVGKSPESKEAKRLSLEENIRLMYVGMTRARDYLVFATRDPHKANWLKELTDADGRVVVELPRVSEDTSIRVSGSSFPCKVRTLNFEDDFDIDEAPDVPVYVATGTEANHLSFIPAHFQPSHPGRDSLPREDVVQYHESELIPIGGRIPITGEVDMTILGTMVHSFLGADNSNEPQEKRMRMAEDIQRRFGIAVISPNAMIQAADRLQEFLSDKYPDIISIHREWPIHIRIGEQRASGWVDVAVETSSGWVILDHKSFPGSRDAWEGKARSYLPQLRVYAAALDRATGRPVIGAWIHMPLVGVMVGFSGSSLSVE